MAGREVIVYRVYIRYIRRQEKDCMPRLPSPMRPLRAGRLAIWPPEMTRLAIWTWRVCPKSCCWGPRGMPQNRHKLLEYWCSD